MYFFKASPPTANKGSKKLERRIASECFLETAVKAP